MRDTRQALDRVAAERLRQTALWGIQDHDWASWMLILGEEVGEAMREANGLHFDPLPDQPHQDGRPGALARLRDELVQVAAVAVQIVEAIGSLPGDQTTRPGWDTFWMRMAQDAANRATCPRAAVGCVIVDHKQRVISLGYNGAPAGEPHCTDVGCDMRERAGRPSCHRADHAERNALRWADEAGRGCEFATAYVTLRPCRACMADLIQAGVARVVYLGDYPDTTTIDLARAGGVRLQRLEA